MLVLRRAVVLLFFLGLVLALPQTSVAGSVPRGRAAQVTPSLFSRLGSFLAWLRAEGCAIDPLGGCGDRLPPPAEVDTGCAIDPLGHCLPNSTAGADSKQTGDNGCDIDPLGGCGH